MNIHITKEQSLNLLEAIHFWQNLPDEQLNQHLGLIYQGEKEPCGCFGAHMAKFFDCRDLDYPESWGWHYEHFRLREIFGIWTDDLREAGAGDHPFGAAKWDKNPADVLSLIYEKATIT